MQEPVSPGFPAAVRHLQVLSRAISISFAATSGRGCVGVSPGHPAPRVWECAFCLLPCILTAGPLPAETIDQSRQNVGVCCPVGAVFRHHPAAPATSEHRDVYLMAPQPGLHVSLWLPSFLRTSVCQGGRLPLISTLCSQPPQQLELGKLWDPDSGIPESLEKRRVPSYIPEGAGRSNSHGVSPWPFSILRERLSALCRVAPASRDSRGTLGLALLSPNSILMS